MKYLIILAAITGAFGLGQIKLIEEKSSILITGTSSLHDWEMDVQEFDVNGSISDTQVQNLVVTIKSKSMKSGKSIMDGKAYDAVKADKYPEIKFTAKTLQVQGAKVSGAGKLEIGGESRTVNLSAEIKSNSGGTMQIVGEVPLKMTDFDIDPPTAMFGTLKTGDELVIKYDILIEN